MTDPIHRKLIRNQIIWATLTGLFTALAAAGFGVILANKQPGRMGTLVPALMFLPAYLSNRRINWALIQAAWKSRSDLSRFTPPAPEPAWKKPLATPRWWLPGIIALALASLCVGHVLFEPSPADRELRTAELCNQNNDKAGAFAAYLRAAEAGSATGCHNAAVCLSAGIGTRTDLKQAAHWFHMAAKQGNPASQSMYAQCLREGLGVEKNPGQAIHWYTLAAKEGHIPAQANLGSMYAKGEGTPLNWEQAAKWSRMAAEQGHVLAQHNLGMAYAASAPGWPTNPVESTRWFKRASEQGFAPAQLEYGRACLFGNGIPRDAAAGIAWIKKAAAQGDAEAICALGQCLHAGLGTQSDKPSALACFLKAAGLGVAKAHHNAAIMLNKGDGVPPNLAEALSHFEAAANQGEVESAFELGLHHHKNRGYADAVRWYTQAAQAGHARANTGIGTLYGAGQGVPTNLVEGYARILVGKKLGDSQADTYIKIVAPSLSESALRAATERATEILKTMPHQSA